MPDYILYTFDVQSDCKNVLIIGAVASKFIEFVSMQSYK